MVMDSFEVRLPRTNERESTMEENLNCHLDYFQVRNQLEESPHSLVGVFSFDDKHYTYDAVDFRMNHYDS